MTCIQSSHAKNAKFYSWELKSQFEICESCAPHQVSPERHQQREEGGGASCQASGCLSTSAMSKAEASEACSTGYSLLTIQWISVSGHS